MRRLLGVVLVIISAVSFGAMPVFARLAYEAGTDPISLLFLRFSIAAGLMLALMLGRRMAFPRGGPLLGLIGMGSLGYVGQSLCYFTALTLASAGLVALLLYLYPVLVTVLAAAVLKERITRLKVAALFLALAGAGLTIGPGGGRPLGVALALGAAVIYALYILSGSQIMQRVPAIPASTVIMTSTAVVYGGLVAVRGINLPGTAAGWGGILALALISTVVAVATFLEGLERIGATNASTLSVLEPAVTVVLAAMLLGEAATPVRVAGGALILAAVIILTRGEFGGQERPAGAPRSAVATDHIADGS